MTRSSAGPAVMLLRVELILIWAKTNREETTINHESLNNELGDGNGDQRGQRMYMYSTLLMKTRLWSKVNGLISN